MGEPFWVDDDGFDVKRHVVPLGRVRETAGIFSYRARALFGLYADPEALPEVTDLPAALWASLLALSR